MNKTLVIIPTYNEIETLPRVIDAVLVHDGFDVLVVDDGSPDGTGAVVRDRMAISENVFLIERTGKLGLGTAYVEGFKWGLEREYNYFIEMDADFSHDPAMLPKFIAEMEKGLDLVIGSRYLHGTISVVGWDFHRLLLSKFGNLYASSILSLHLTDLTSGFRCYSRKALESIGLDRIHSNGYAFQIEMAFRIAAVGLRIGEQSIIFYERESGLSKMSEKIIREAVVLPWRLRLGRLRYYSADMKSGRAGFHNRTVIGFFLALFGLAGGLALVRWLLTEGDIIEYIHQVKLGLPDWAWVTMKVGLSAFAAAAFAGLLVALAISVFAGGDASGNSEIRDREPTG